MVGLPRLKHFNVPLQAPFLQSFRETGHLFHAVGSFGRKPSTAIKSIEPLAQEATPILVASFDAHGDTEYKFFPPGPHGLAKTIQTNYDWWVVVV